MSRSLAVPVALALAVLASSGCAHGPGVSSDQLPLRRVVVYRNGVGYFERAGRVRGDKVAFQVRPTHVGDFLATLSVMEKGGSSVRAVSFPMHQDEDESPVPVAPPGAPGTPKNGLETVTLALDGQEHQLAVGYVSEQPVWRPSYRIVLDEQGATLQAWGIVQNLSGEDWRDVSLSLVAGAPIAYRSTLGTPVIPQRPVLDDSGETLTAVPTSENSLPAPMTEPSPSMAEERDEAPSAPMRSMGAGLLGAAPSFQRPRPAHKRANFADSLAQQNALMASTATSAGATRYDLPERVSLPKDSATMVLLTSRAVPGEGIHLFAPNGGVPDSTSHPFRVARFTNSTPGLLEKGPIAVFDHDSFLGQGVLESLSSGGKAVVPFALDRSLSVKVERSDSVQGARLAHLEAGRLELEQARVAHMVYRLQNGGPTPAKVMLKLVLDSGARLLRPPQGTEQDEGEGAALIPGWVGPRGKAQVAVDQQTPFRTQADWSSPEADAAFAAYIADPRADAKLKDALASVRVLTRDLRQAREERTGLQAQRQVLTGSADQVRASLRAIQKSAGAEDLRRTLMTRLGDLESRLGATEKRLVELEMKVNEGEVRLQERVRDLRMDQPLPEA